MLRSRAHKRGLELVVECHPWPETGSVQKIGERIVVTIDSRQSRSDRLHALAHEAGHVLLGHYRMADGIWTMRPKVEGERDEWENEAEFFAMFVCRSRCMPAEWILGGQLDLPLSSDAP